jgi:heme-degrading monooxygenase HmoA
MYARVTTMQPRQGLAGEAAKIFRESVIPAAQQQMGFRGAMLLEDPASGRGTSITLWETEADLMAGEESGYFKEQIAKFGPLMEGPPVREVLVVTAQALPGD